MHEKFGEITFSSDFDSGNLASVEQVDLSADDVIEKSYDYEFRLWTSPDAAGTPNENTNRTWFHFSVQGCIRNKKIKFTLMNLNKQSKLFTQGMSPVYKIVPSTKAKWNRIRERTTHEMIDGEFQLTFVHTFSDVYKRNQIYFAFTYPYAYEECQQNLQELECLHSGNGLVNPCGIYFHRDILCNSNDGLNIDLLTVTSLKNITDEEESCIEYLYPDHERSRAKRFRNKKIFFLTSRVHPGETPASFVFNGFVKFILDKDDKRAIILRDLFVFKLIPMLNPDGVKRGHYRTDAFGVNLNRVYLNPDRTSHPSIYAVKKLMEYHHFKPASNKDSNHSKTENYSEKNSNSNNLLEHEIKVSKILNETDENFLKISQDKHKMLSSDYSIDVVSQSNCLPDVVVNEHGVILQYDNFIKDSKSIDSLNNNIAKKHNLQIEEQLHNGIDIYVDLHGHASKQGCFIYGNYFEKESNLIDSMLFPKLISLNSVYFDFLSCNFSEKNMYHKDKRDGQSKEGSGRVAMAKTLGIIHSYTLECNYNSGRTINQLTPLSVNNNQYGSLSSTPVYSSRYAPEHYEEVGAGMAIAVLDMYNKNPMSRLPLSSYKSLSGVQNWLKKFCKGHNVRRGPLIKKNTKGGKSNKHSSSSMESKSDLLTGPSHDVMRKIDLNKVFIPKPASRSIDHKTPLIFLKQIQASSRTLPMQTKDKKLNSISYGNFKTREVATPKTVTECVLRRKLISPNFSLEKKGKLKYV